RPPGRRAGGPWPPPPHVAGARPRGLPARRRPPLSGAHRRVRPGPRRCRLGAQGPGPRDAGRGHRYDHAHPGACHAPCRRRSACARRLTHVMTVAVIPVPGLPMIQPGDDLGTLLADAIDAARVGVKPRDVVAVCQKVVSKAEGAVVRLADVTASPFATVLAGRTEGGKDARAMEVVLRETARIVRMDRGHV